MSAKADYVRSQGQTRRHHCHWPGCDRQVPPAMWGCKAHWFTLPAGLRAKVWAAYRPGQEVNGTPSAAYLTVAREVQAWIRDREAPVSPTLTGASVVGHNAEAESPKTGSRSSASDSPSVGTTG